MRCDLYYNQTAATQLSAPALLRSHPQDVAPPSSAIVPVTWDDFRWVHEETPAELMEDLPMPELPLIWRCVTRRGLTRATGLMCCC